MGNRAGEHDISYCPRQAIKGQALADFLVETNFVEKPKLVETIPDVAKDEPTDDEPPECWQVYVDGASGKAGSGAGILFIGPAGQEVTYSLRFTFPTTNNEVEYEVLLAGLRLAHSLQIRAVRVHSDSQVIVNHMLGKYEAKGDRMKKFLDKAKELQKSFLFFQLIRVPRGQNSRADTLSKLASSATTSSPVEEVHRKSIEDAEVNVVTEDDPNWMTPLRGYLERGELPDDKLEARKILSKSLHYTLDQGVLYRKSYLQPLLRCVGPR